MFACHGRRGDCHGTGEGSKHQTRGSAGRAGLGDTLGGIADRFSVETEDVRKWNHLKANRVSRGMVLRIYTLGGAPEAQPVRTSHPKKKTARTPGPVAQNAAPTASPN